MADVQSNIHVNIDTSDALASLKLLQRQISAFHTQMAKSGTAASAVAANQAQNLMNSINATGQFQASMRTVTSSTESFTNALEKNKLTSREYFRYTGAATKTFGRLFKSEFETINKVARERVKDLQTQYIKMGRGANGALQAIAVRPLTLDMKNLGTQTAIAAQRQQLLNQLLKQGSTNLLNFGKNTQWAGRQLMVGFTVPLVMLGTQAAKTFMQLEEQAIRFKRVYGELFTTAEETDAMVKDIQLLAKEYTKYGVAVEATMKMAADAAAQGKMGADLMAQIAQATRLAVLGGVEQEQALETTISVTNAFGVATEDLAKKIDFLNAVENQTVVSIEDLTIAIPKAGPVVQQLGGDVEDLAFFLTAMKEGGINASEGANALKSGLASLINPSEKASKFLAGLGVNIKGIVEANAGDVTGTVVDFARALDTLDPLNRARAIEQLFGKFQFSRLSTLFQNVTAEGTQASRVLGLAKATTEELAILSERELSKIENTTTYKFKKSIEDLKVTLAPVGEQFLKALTPIVEFAAKILDKFNDLGDGSKRFITILTVALGAVGPLALMSFGLLANGIANIIKLFAGLKSVFNRAGSSTQILGQQTSYLTQEQLEASAVAASLDQVHQKLRQTFTSEATAVNTLASAYRNAIAAQLGFTGPVRGGKPGATQAGKKYSTGTTRVPGTGNKDTVPSVLTPGEAVIPADVAQDPQFKPIIHAMVNRRLKGFNGGTTYASQSEQATEKLQFAHATEKQVIDLDDVDDEFKKEAQNLKARGLKQANAYSGLGFDIPEKLHGELRENKASLDEYIEEIKKPRAIQTMTENLMKKNPALTASEAAKVTDKIRRELISSLELIPRVTTADGFKPHLIGDDLVASRVGDLKSGIVGSLVEDKKYSDAVKRVFGAAGIGPKGTPKNLAYDKKATPKELLDAVKSTGQQSIVTAVQRLVDNHPDFEVPVRKDANGNIVAYSRPEVSRTPPYKLKGTNNNAELNDEGKFVAGRADGSSGSVKVAGTASKKIRQAVARALFGLTPAELKGKEITTYANQIAQGTGFSNVAAKHLSGLHETHDGKKVFVKPMMDLRSALAEQRATQIAREVHGLDAPNQQLRIIQDPTTGKTMYALESPYDAKFNPDSMENKFDKDQYIRQNVAASLRADMDLGRGNLSGNVLADVGPAGVFSRASGERDFAFGLDENGKKIVNLPSMEEQAIKNLDLNEKVPNRKKFFAEATLDIIKDMTPEEYEKAMKDEIRRALPKLKETVANFKDLDADEKRVYKAMIKRLEDGLKADWKAVHARAVAPVQDLKNKVAVAKDEAVQEEKSQKLTKPKMEPLPGNVKSDAGPRDTMMIDKPKKGSRVVNMPKKPRKSRRVGKFTIPGEADAPMATGVVSMPGSAKPLSELTNAYVKGAIANLATVEAAGKQIGTTIANASAEETKIVSKKRVRRATRGQGPAPIGPETPAGAIALPLVSRPAEAPAPAPSGRVDRYLAGREQKRQDRIAAGKGPGIGLTGGAMAASGVAMMASMVPGQVGEMAQKIMMPLMGISMILPMLQSKFAALTLGVGLVVGAYAYQKMAFDKAQDAALKLTEAMGSGSEAMKTLSTFAGKVSAGEIMDRRRKDSFSPFQIKTGKTTFGQSFMAGEDGKAMAKNVGETVKTQGKDAAKGQVVNQMATAVASGALDAAQARSIVANLAQEMGDYSFGIEVNGKLNELLGPNGENILKDPVGVRVKLLQDTREKMNLSNDAAKKAGGFTGKDVGKSAAYMTGGAAIGGIGGAIAGGILGTIGGPAGTAAGAILGAKVGAALGTVAGNFFGRKDRNKRIGEASGANVAMQKIALQQQQELMDSLELEYQNKLQIAKAAGNQVEAERLTNEYIKNRNTLLAENSKLVSDVQTNFKNAEGATKKALMTGADKAVTKQYKGTALEDVVPLAQQQINDSGVSQEMQYTLKMQMASGQMDPMQMIEIFETFGKDKAAIEKVVSIVGKFGGKFANQMMGVVGMFKDPKQATDFVARISTKTAPEAQKELELFQRISQLGAAIPDISVALDYYNKNPAAAAALQKTIDEINSQKGKIDLQIATKILGAEEMAILKADQEYFNSLPPEQQKVYLQTLTTMVNMEGNNKEAIQNWLKANPGKTEGDYYRASVFAVTESSKDNTSAPIKGNTSGAAAKVDSSPLDELLKKLRDVRKNQIKVTEGWGASQKALNKIFGGSKTIKIFDGLENDMRRLGAGEDLIDLITGMDPKEYEERKKSLFKFDAKGNITKIKDNARSIGDAIASISLGEFVSDQERMSKQIGNQTTALTRLKAAGVEGSVALEAVADATFAASIANKNLSDAQIKKIVAAWNEATKKKKNYAAVQTIEQLNTDLDERVLLLQRMTELSSVLNEEQKETINDSSELQSILVNLSSIKPGSKYFEEFLKVLNKTIVVKKSEVVIKQLKLVRLQEIFDKGFNAAMDKADVDEKKIQLDFEFETRTLNNQIDTAQDMIAAYQYNIDDQEAMLRGIEKQEQKINDKYDERIEALDQVEKANAAISAQQKGQLTLAEALTSGDIAAAARAAQEMRAQAAADAVTKEKEALQQSREYELSQVRQDGKSRDDIESEIKRLQDLVFAQEEKIEFDQELIRQKEVLVREATKPIDIERARWERMQNDIDIARTSNEVFMDLMTQAEKIVKELIEEYKNQKLPKPGPILPAGKPICPPGSTMDANGNCIPASDTPTCPDGYVRNSKGDCQKAEEAGVIPDPPKLKWCVTLGRNVLEENYDKECVGMGTSNSSEPTKKKTKYCPSLGRQIPEDQDCPGVGKLDPADKGNIPQNGFTQYYDKAKAEYDAWVAKSKLPGATPSDFGAGLAGADRKVVDAITLVRQKDEYDKQVAAIAKAKITPTDFGASLAAKDAAVINASKKVMGTPKTLVPGTGVYNGSTFIPPQYKSMGGIIKHFSMGGFARGTDTVPAMLTPGEFVMSKYAVDSHGLDTMKAMNKGQATSGAVYNNTYTLTVNAKTDANPNDIAQAVMSTIKRVDDRRIKGVSLNGR